MAHLPDFLVRGRGHGLEIDVQTYASEADVAWVKRLADERCPAIWAWITRLVTRERPAR